MTATPAAPQRTKKRFFFIGLVLLAVLAGSVAADRFLKSKGHSGVFRMAGQLIRNYPKSWGAKAPYVSLEVSEKNMAKIQAVVDSARVRGVILAEGNSYVKGKLTDADGTFKVKLRIKGKMTDHVTGRKWSFRVIARDTGDFLGMRRFSLQHPGTRGYMNDWLYHRMMKGEGLVALRFGFCTVDLNGDGLGVYAYEEHFGQELLDHNNRPRGPLLRFDPEEFWQKRLAWMRKEKVEPGLGTYQRAGIDAYDTKDILADSLRSQQMDSAVARIDRFRQGLSPASVVFDADLLARHLANNDLIGGHRSLDWSDVKFYYNPVRGVVEPVSYESFSGFPTKELAGAHRHTGPFSPNDELHTQWFKDTTLMTLYIHHLERYTQTTYLDSTFTALTAALDSAGRILFAEYPWKELDKRFYYRNQATVRRLLENGAQLNAHWALRQDSLEVRLVGKGSLPVVVLSLTEKNGAEVRLPARMWVPAAPESGGASVRTVLLAGDHDLQGAVLRYALPGSSVEHELVMGAAKPRK